MVYAYCRKDDNHSVRSIENWADNNSIIVNEFVWDDDAKQKDSYDKRKLGLYLFPKMRKGDILIVSEISCIGRSVIELQRIIDTILAKKRIRLVCLSINMDINFAKVTASDSHLLEKFSFAAMLQKKIIHETTKAALAHKKNKGIKLGGANETYQKNLMLKSKEEREFSHIKSGLTKGKRHLENPETQAFIQILRETFNLDEDNSKWNWDTVTTRGHFKEKILQKIEDYQNSKGYFTKWGLNRTNEELTQRRLSAYINSLRRSFTSYYSKKKYENMTLEDYVNLMSSNGTKVTHTVPNSQSTKRQRRGKTTSDKHTDIILDMSQLSRIEEDTKESQKILSDIFTDTDITEDINIKVSKDVMEIMRMLLTKEVWTFEEVEMICKKKKQIIGAVLEQINDYALSIVDDIILDEDGNNIYVMTEYKEILL